MIHLDEIMAGLNDNLGAKNPVAAQAAIDRFWEYADADVPEQLVNAMIDRVEQIESKLEQYAY